MIVKLTCSNRMSFCMGENCDASRHGRARSSLTTSTGGGMRVYYCVLLLHMYVRGVGGRVAPLDAGLDSASLTQSIGFWIVPLLS